MSNDSTVATLATTARLALAIKEAEPEQHAAVRDNPRVSPEQHVDMLLCSLQRVHDILTDQPFYDYGRQEWIDAGC